MDSLSKRAACSLLAMALLSGLTAAPAGGQEISRDSLRAELRLLIPLHRVQMGRDSAWVALVTLSSPPELALTRFNRDNGYFLTYLLGNATTFDHLTFLAAVPKSVDPRSEFYDRLGADTAFVAPLHQAVNAYLGAEADSGAYKPRLATEGLVALAARFLRLDAGPDGQPRLSICAKSDNLRERPIPSTPVLEAWLYSVVRPGLEDGHLDSAMHAVNAILENRRLLGPDDVMVAQRQIWQAAANDSAFRAYVVTELRRRARHIPFALQE